MKKLANLKDHVVGGTSTPMGRCKLFRKRTTGRLGEDRTAVIEFNEEIPSDPGKDNVILRLLNGEHRLGITSGLVRRIVRLEVIGLGSSPYIVRGGFAREIGRRRVGNRHGGMCNKSGDGPQSWRVYKTLRIAASEIHTPFARKGVLSTSVVLRMIISLH